MSNWIDYSTVCFVACATLPSYYQAHSLQIKETYSMSKDNSLIQPACMQACEMFILELTLRSWNHSEENKRRTLQRNDIAAAITRTDIFDFLVSRVHDQHWGKACRPESLLNSEFVFVYMAEHACLCAAVIPKMSFHVCSDAQVDIVPREERDDAAMIPRVPQPMSGAMPGMQFTLMVDSLLLLSLKACNLMLCSSSLTLTLHNRAFQALSLQLQRDVGIHFASIWHSSAYLQQRRASSGLNMPVSCVQT